LKGRWKQGEQFLANPDYFIEFNGIQFITIHMFFDKEFKQVFSTDLHFTTDNNISLVKQTLDKGFTFWVKINEPTWMLLFT